MKEVFCPSCQSKLDGNDKFCPACGNQVSENVIISTETQNKSKTIISTGSYSGTMAKGKKSKTFIIIRNTIIGLILIALIALFVWFQVDPDAGKKLVDVTMGIAFMTVFFLVGWLFMRGKKGKSETNWGDDQYTEVAYDDNDDD